MAGSSHCRDIALYTGNDNNIVVDLLTPYRFQIKGRMVEKRIVRGLLGHWAVWTQNVVKMFEAIRAVREHAHIPTELLARAAQVTAVNAALLDAEHQFAGSIAGIHEVLFRQGLLAGTWCLDPAERLSPGQLEKIVAMKEEILSLSDDDFVAEHLESWLSPGR